MRLTRDGMRAIAWRRRILDDPGLPYVFVQFDVDGGCPETCTRTRRPPAGSRRRPPIGFGTRPDVSSAPIAGARGHTGRHRCS